MWILTAFLFGFMGSFHCAGMCGPIALTLPKKATGTALEGKIFYNVGRIITYSILGAIIGLFGRSLMLAGFQKTVSIVSGISIVLIAGLPLISRKFQPFNGILYKLTATIKKIFRKLLSSDSRYSLLAIGLANGILPCGFVYLALGASLAMGSIGGSMGYMALFGLGTAPMMLFLALSGQMLNFKFQRYIRIAVPYIALVMGALLIFRGITYVPQSCCSH
ncbi:MAG: sulfite exporter TauE/SafE family protein [Bacteroidetes bacterium]|nr:sulfite exporter TauE/SafE family protein [Bacteroidota bacterium]